LYNKITIKTSKNYVTFTPRSQVTHLLTSSTPTDFPLTLASSTPTQPSPSHSPHPLTLSYWVICIYSINTHLLMSNPSAPRTSIMTPISSATHRTIAIAAPEMYRERERERE